MADEHAIARYRHWYRKLLRFYSRPYRERFAESMEQTFNDLCRERARSGKGIGRFRTLDVRRNIGGNYSRERKVHHYAKKAFFALRS